MKFTDIFINKPVLAIVVSLFILLFGRDGWLWPLIEDGVRLHLPVAGEVLLQLPRIVFAIPGIVLARVRTHLAVARQARERERLVARLEQDLGVRMLNRTTRAIASVSVSPPSIALI